MTSTTVRTCKRCLYTTAHPLGLVVDEDGICSGCRIHEEKDYIDWTERWDKLERLVKPYRSRDTRNYDCIVPVTGAGDSFFILHIVKERLGLKPLLVTYNRYYNTPLGIRNLAQLRRRFDCDILIQSVNPVSVKKIIRSCLRSFGSIHWPVLAGQSVFPVQTATSHQVPLIIWGAHQGLEQVGMFSHLNEVEMSRRYRKDHDLMGYEADDLLSTTDSLTEADIWKFRYPDEDTLEKIGVRGIYLGNYIRWDPFAQHLQMEKIAGYHSGVMPRTFDVHDHVDDWYYMDLHDWLRQCKHGYGKVVDQLCREIRHGRITRPQALMLARHHLSIEPLYVDMFADWLGLHSDGFRFIVNHHKHLRRSNMMSSLDCPHSEPGISINSFGWHKPISTLSVNRDVEHIIIGKGYPD